MDDFGPLFAIIAFFISVIILVKMSLDYKTTKLQARNGPDNSMGKNELKLLIQEAVEQGTAPLHRRLAELEIRADHESLIGVASSEPSKQLYAANGAESSHDLQA